MISRLRVRAADGGDVGLGHRDGYAILLHTAHPVRTAGRRTLLQSAQNPLRGVPHRWG